MISPTYLATLIEAHWAKQARRETTSVSQLEVERDTAELEHAA